MWQGGRCDIGGRCSRISREREKRHSGSTKAARCSCRGHRSMHYGAFAARSLWAGGPKNNSVAVHIRRTEPPPRIDLRTDSQYEMSQTVMSIVVLRFHGIVKESYDVAHIQSLECALLRDDGLVRKVSVS